MDVRESALDFSFFILHQRALVTIKLLCRLLIILFANSLDQQNLGPDLDPNCFYTLMAYLKEFFEKKLA